MQRAVFVSDAIATRTCTAENAAEAYYDAYKFEPFGRGHVPVSRHDFRQKYSGNFGGILRGLRGRGGGCKSSQEIQTPARGGRRSFKGL